jgi:hypothetical protein
VLRDECGHSLGLGVVHMARSDDVERVFNAHQCFEVSGSRVDLWEPAETEDSQVERIVVYVLGAAPAMQTGRGTSHANNQPASRSVAQLMRRLIRTLVPSSRTVGH